MQNCLIGRAFQTGLVLTLASIVVRYVRSSEGDNAVVRPNVEQEDNAPPRHFEPQVPAIRRKSLMASQRASTNDLLVPLQSCRTVIRPGPARRAAV